MKRFLLIIVVLSCLSSYGQKSFSKTSVQTKIFGKIKSVDNSGNHIWYIELLGDTAIATIGLASASSITEETPENTTQVYDNSGREQYWTSLQEGMTVEVVLKKEITHTTEGPIYWARSIKILNSQNEMLMNPQLHRARQLFQSDNSGLAKEVYMSINENELNDIDLCNLGVIFLNSGDAYKAIYYFEKSARFNNVKAMQSLGNIYSSYDANGGHEELINFKIGIYWYNKAANFDDSYSMFAMAISYYMGGYGIEKNISMSNYWMKKACEKGYDGACDWINNRSELKNIMDRQNSRNK